MSKPRCLAKQIFVPCLLVCAAVAEGADGQPTEQGQEESPDYVEYIEVQDSSLPTSNTIATKLNVPLQLTPANVGTVGTPLLFEQDARTLSDALENVSGLNVQNGSGTYDFFTIRGFDSTSSGLVMTDGAAEPEATYYGMYNVEGVEVFKGPAGFLYGKNALAGAVNIVRKQPLAANFLAAGGSFGSFGARGTTLDWNQAGLDGAVGFRLNGLWSAADNYRDDKDSTHWALNPSFTWRSAAGSRLTVNYERVDAEYAPDNGIPLVASAIPDVSRRTSYQGNSDFSDQTLDRLQVDFEKKLTDHVSVRSKVYHRGLDWRSDGALLLGTTDQILPGQVQVIRDLAVLDDRQTFFGGQFEVVVSGQTGAVEHRMLAGLELAHESDEFTFDLRELTDQDLYDQSATFVNCGASATYDGSNPCQSPELASVGDVTNKILAPYAIDQMQLSSEVQLLVGARYDRIETDGDVLPLTGPFVGVFSPIAYSTSAGKVSPMAGLLWAPTPELSLYVSTARSYSPPSTRIVDDVDPGSREPERGTQVEIGAKRQFAGGKLRTTVAVYQIDRDNIAIADANFFTQQSGDQRSRGVEFELAAEPLPRLRTFFSYAYNDAELTTFRPFDPATQQFVDYSGNDPILAPRNIATLWVSKSFRGGLGLAGGTRFIDEQFVSEANTFALDRALVFDGGVFYDWKAWRFKVNLKNLTNEEYETRGVAGASSVIPANPFSAYAGIEFRM